MILAPIFSILVSFKIGNYRTLKHHNGPPRFCLSILGRSYDFCLHFEQGNRPNARQNRPKNTPPPTKTAPIAAPSPTKILDIIFRKTFLAKNYLEKWAILGQFEKLVSENASKTLRGGEKLQIGFGIVRKSAFGACVVQIRHEKGPLYSEP